MIIVSSGTGTVTNINTTAPLSGGPITTSGTITTAMATNKLIGRSTAGIGTMEEITVGTGLTLTGGTLSSTGGATAAGNTNEIQFNNGGAFAASSNLDWIIADNRLLLGSENTADINSRMVIIGKGISTNNTFVVHNSTGTNNALVVKDDTRVGIATATPAATLSIGTIHNFSLTGSGGSAIFVSRLDQNSNTIWSFDNRTSGTNSEVVIFLRSTDEGTSLSHTSPLYTNNYNGSEGRAGVLYTKLQNTNAGKQKYAISNTSSAAINKFEWISAVVANGTLSNGFGTTAPIMTLIGNGNLLLGTTSQGASATKTLVINNGTAPTGNVTDSFQQYSADIVAGNAAPHFRTENGNIIKVYQETTGVASATFVQNSGNRVDEVSTFDGYTIAQVVKALRNQGLLA